MLSVQEDHAARCVTRAGQGFQTVCAGVEQLTTANVGEELSARCRDHAGEEIIVGQVHVDPAAVFVELRQGSSGMINVSVCDQYINRQGR